MSQCVVADCAQNLLEEKGLRRTAVLASRAAAAEVSAAGRGTPRRVAYDEALEAASKPRARAWRARRRAAPRGRSSRP